MENFEINKHILSNGLTVLYCHTPNLVSFELTMHINTGARDESHDKIGISHFLEHMMFRGCTKYPNSCLLAKAMESFGGETNAMTGVETTNYWIKGSSEKTLEAIDCFHEFFLKPNYADLEIERHVILQEMASDFNEDGLSVDTEALGMQTLFDENPLGNTIIGSENSVRNITIQDLEEKRKQFYTPSNCILTIHTSTLEADVLKTIQKVFSASWNYANKETTTRLKINDYLPQPNKIRKPQNALCLQNNPDNQFALKLIFPTVGNLSKEIVNITFLQRILDDGICTRLPANIREKYGLVYDISCDSQFFHDCGTFSIDATVSEEYLDELLEKLGKEFSSLIKEKPLDDEIEHIKFRYLFDIKQVQETPARLLSRSVTECFMGTTFPLIEEKTHVELIDAQTILNTAKKIFGATRRGFVLVGPKARKKRAQVEKFLSYFDNLEAK